MSGQKENGSTSDLFGADFGRTSSSSSTGSGFGSGFATIPDVGNIDINKLSKRPSQGPDYIPYNTRGRDSFGRISFNTGVFWLGGFLAGGTYGVYKGWSGVAAPSYKIRFNSIMNGFSKHGSNLGNSLGTIGEIFIS